MKSEETPKEQYVDSRKINYSKSEYNNISDKMIDTTIFIDKYDFTNSIKRATTYSINLEALGGIAPHHGVASGMIGNFYSTLAANTTPEVIILLGPNHPAMGDKYQSGNFLYNTYNGIIETDKDMLNALYKHNVLTEASSEYFSKEHSLNIHMNYIGYYFKDAKVMPIIIGESRLNEDIDEMAEAIYGACKNKNYLIICSVDFSHYLTLDEANKRDELTEKLLFQKDQKTLISLDNNYLDCPSAILLMFKILELDGDMTCQIIDHSNSAIILEQNNLHETTSYFTAIYGCQAP